MCFDTSSSRVVSWALHQWWVRRPSHLFTRGLRGKFPKMHWEKGEVMQDHKVRDDLTNEQTGKWVSPFNRLKIVGFASNLFSRFHDCVVIDYGRKAELTSIAHSDQLWENWSSQVLTFHSLTGWPPSYMVRACSMAQPSQQSLRTFSDIVPDGREISECWKVNAGIVFRRKALQFYPEVQCHSRNKKPGIFQYLKT